MTHLKSVEKKMIVRFLEKLKEIAGVNLHQAVLFGSKARGDSHKGSDIDLLIVVDSKNSRFKSRIQDSAWDVMMEFDFKFFLSPVVYAKKDFDQYLKWNSSFLMNVLKDGVVL